MEVEREREKLYDLVCTEFESQLKRFSEGTLLKIWLKCFFYLFQ